jgi:ABC-type multidrug transport system permease subunit
LKKHTSYGGQRRDSRSRRWVRRKITTNQLFFFIKMTLLVTNLIIAINIILVANQNVFHRRSSQSETRFERRNFKSQNWVSILLAQLVETFFMVILNGIFFLFFKKKRLMGKFP